MDDAILKMRGMKPKEEKPQSTLAPKKCSRCQSINKATSSYCSSCGSVLDIQAAVGMQDKLGVLDDKIDELLDDPEVQQLLLQKVKKMKLFQ